MPTVVGGQLADLAALSDSPTSLGTPVPSSITGVGGAADAPTMGATPRPGTQTGPITGSSEGMTATAGASARGSSTPLTVGQDFGARYHIIKLLGVGGMGAVYQAWDKTLEVAVAVKVIRPLASMDAEEAHAVEKRFKRELLLARSVTHKNVVRIHDLGEIDGITYITMPYVQGSDLSSILKRDGRLPVDRTLSVMRQVAAGLVAAHKAGVVHRDLKPANIMVDADGEALIMDFGIARSTEQGATMTVGGAVVGTIEYMAPEQAKGEQVDARADVYAFGLMMNDLLLGRRQGGANTAMASLMARMQAPPPSIRSVDPAMPESLDAIVTKCVQPDPAARYQQMAELLADLEHLDENGHPKIGTTVTASITMPAAAPPAVKKGLSPLVLVAAGALVIVGAGGAWLFRDSLFSSSPSAPVGPTVSLAILPFRNASGDPTLDSLGANLSQELSAELGQSARVRAVPQDRIRQALKDLHFAPTADLQPTDVASIADFTSAKRVLSGEIGRLGDGVRLNATLQNLETKQTTPLTASAPNMAALVPAITDLADKVRAELGKESSDLARDLKLTAVKPSTSSFEALALYNEGLQLAKDNKQADAQAKFQKATEKDGNFALAFSGLARANQAQGFESEAAAADKKAMSLAETLPPGEKYLIQANHFTTIGDTKSAREAYESLSKAQPTNASLHYDLGFMYEGESSFPQAKEHYAKAVALDPKYVTALTALGRVEVRLGNIQPALDHLSSALNVATQLKNDPVRADVLHAIGIAYKRSNRPEDALKNYTESFEIRKSLGLKRDMARSLNEIAQVLTALGKPKEGEASFRQAMALQKEINDKTALSTTLVNLASLLNDNLGRPDDALPLLREALQIRRDAKNSAGEASVLNAIGVVYLAKGSFDDAQTNFEQALQIREKKPAPNEMADTLHNLGETHSKMGRYAESLKSYERALQFRRDGADKRGAAIESVSMGTIFDYMGRYGAAVKAKEDALQTFRDLKISGDMWLGEILSGLGNSLALSGRMDEATKDFDEAAAVGAEIKNASLVAQTTRFKADRLYLAGDGKGAVAAAADAQKAAAQAQDKSMVFQAKVTAALADSIASPATAALAARFDALAAEADSLGLKAVSVECLLHRAEALLASGDRAGARAQADRVIAKAETGNFRLSLARARYVKAETLRQSKDGAAQAEYATALRLFNDIKAEDGNANILKRADVGRVYDDCVKWSKGT
jgi:serine/threonine protein kinase/tetratricopeptide (TPR) repeat protein